MKHANMLFMLTMMAALTALSIDIYIPSMPGMAHSFGTDAGSVQLTLSAFIFSFALGQLVLGPLSDRFGRKPILIAGLMIYLIANLACAMAQTITELIIFRVLQGFGACCGTVICFAVVRDIFGDSQRARALAKVAGGASMAPILAPSIGAFLDVRFGWTSSFFFLAAVSVVMLVLTFKWLPETLPTTRRSALLSAFRAYKHIFQHRGFVAYTVVNACAFAGLFAYIAGSSFLMIEHYGLSSGAYALMFGSNAVLYMLGSIALARYARNWSLHAMITIGGRLLMSGGLVMLIFTSLVDSVWALALPMYICTLGISILLPASSSGALAPFPNNAGGASALQGCLRFAAGALSGALIGAMSPTSPLPLSMVLVACAGLCLFDFGRNRCSDEEQESPQLSGTPVETAS